MIAPQLEQKINALRAPAGQPVVAEQAGSVQWSVVDGARVNGGCETVGEIRSPYSSCIIGCDHVGTLRYAVSEGTQVKRGDVLAYVAPLAPEPLKRAVPIAPPQHTVPAPKIAPAPSGEALEASEQEPPQRSTLGDPEELVKVEELSLPTPPKPTKRPRRPRVAKRTCHPTNHQIEEFKALLEKLGKRGHDYSAGELERLAFHLLLSLPEQELIVAAEANRDREVAGRYGYGVGPRG